MTRYLTMAVAISFLATLAIIIGQRTTVDQLPLIAAGVIVGFLASIPVAVALIIVVRRRSSVP
jgi:hypothetical protein